MQRGTVWLLLLAACGCGPPLCREGRQQIQLAEQLRGECCAFRIDTSTGRCVARQGARPSFRHEERECARWAAECLGQIGGVGREVLPVLLEAARFGAANYDTGDGVIAAHDAVLEALGKLGDARALPVLLDLLERPRRMETGPGAGNWGKGQGRRQSQIVTAMALAQFGPAARAALPTLTRLVETDPESPGSAKLREAIAKINGSH